MFPDLSIVIPIYNAQHMIKNTLERLVRAVESLGVSYEILLLNDASKDNSGSVLESAKREYEHVNYFTHDVNQGLGVTLRTLFSKAQGKSVIYCDCDLPFGEGVIAPLLSEIDNNDIVVASRYGGLPNRVPLGRKIASRLYFLICKILFNIPVADIGSGSVAVRAEALKQLNLNARGFGIHTEMFVKAARGGLSIKEIPAQHDQTHSGSFRIWKHGLSTLCETFQLWLKKL